MTEPSIVLAEALKSISHSTVTALRAYEQGSRVQLARAEEDIRIVRQERDDAVAAVYETKKQEQSWKQELEKWKGEVDKADIVNAHQAELVAQLRREAQQWKEQCLRLQETSRGEIQDWKEQFLRVDHERARLAARLEQLVVSEPTAHAPYTPKRTLADYGEPSTASTATKRASTSSAHALPPGKTHLSSAKKPRMDTDARSVAPNSTRVIRRVQAVIEVPVKEEEWDPEFEENLGGAGPSVPPAKRKKVGARSRSRHGASDEEGDGDESGDYVDENEGEAAEAEAATAVSRQASRAKARRRVVQEDDEDDELRMGAEDNPEEIYGSHRVVPARPKSITNTAAAAVQKPPTTSAAARKRKAATDIGDGNTTKPRKRK
ncbi:hypothetical protein BV25DRAFT_1921693 [Artomyces pyxidatus]|uniref:Uncharacterized protein n=1 Tax=Artomyces pyxidatus TaxID=48021 RepID=A0ACB8SG95_9AGAM|nr:hypothetical protein BV25DRAFT_1921693 [Artomyces pyxidatus]